jgi:hypothetical protein
MALCPAKNEHLQKKTLSSLHCSDSFPLAEHKKTAPYIVSPKWYSGNNKPMLGVQKCLII